MAAALLSRLALVGMRSVLWCLGWLGCFASGGSGGRSLWLLHRHRRLPRDGPSSHTRYRVCCSFLVAGELALLCCGGVSSARLLRGIEVEAKALVSSRTNDDDACGRRSPS